MIGDRSRRCLAELCGTFTLVLIGPGAAAMDHSFAHATLGTVGVSLAFFLALLAAIIAFAPVSGAHLNPAVTIAFWSIGRFPRREVLPYVLAQCAGAAVAAIALRAALGDAVAAAATVPTVSVIRAFGIELVFSALLMLVILRVSIDARVSPALAALAIAACVGGLALLGPLTGSSMNPARSFGPALVASSWRLHWIYWFAPILGMLATARLAALTDPRSLVTTVRSESALGVEGPIANAALQ